MQLISTPAGSALTEALKAFGKHSRPTPQGLLPRAQLPGLHSVTFPGDANCFKSRRKCSWSNKLHFTLVWLLYILNQLSPVFTSWGGGLVTDTRPPATLPHPPNGPPKEFSKSPKYLRSSPGIPAIRASVAPSSHGASPG